MFFNIEFYRPHVSPEDLLRVKPEVLAKLILHKRERVSESLPKALDQIGTNKHTSENLARQSRTKKEELEPKYNNLINERQRVVTEIQQQSENFTTITNDESYNQLILDLKSAETDAELFNKLLSELTAKFQSQGGEMNKLTHYESSVKANEAFSTIADEFRKVLETWTKNETHRRKLESKFTKLTSNLKDSELAKEFWEQKLTTNLDDLLVDANRVAEGGPSSRQIVRNNKSRTNQRRS